MAKAATYVEYDNAKLLKLMENLEGQPVRILHDGVDYGIWQEVGHHGVAARTFMSPAAEHVRPALMKGLRPIIERQSDKLEVFIVKLAGDAQDEAQSQIVAKNIVDTGALHDSIKFSTPREFQRYARGAIAMAR